MFCIKCNEKTIVTDSRVGLHNSLRRRRKCLNCQEKFTTYEVLSKPKDKSNIVTAWAEVGSHGGIFEFTGGLVAERYPSLMHIYSQKIDDDLREVQIIY